MSINNQLMEYFESKRLTAWMPENVGPFDDGLLTKFFNETDFENKVTIAENIIEKVMEKHSKGDMLPQISELVKIERGAKEFLSHRDHVVHAMFTYLLGWYIIHTLNLSINPLSWKITGLFHDIGYPLEIGSRMDEKYIALTNEIVGKINSDTPPLIFKKQISIENIDRAYMGSSFDLLDGIFDDWGIDVRSGTEYKTMTESGRIDHGIISSLLVLYIISALYRKNNPRLFEVELVGSRDWGTKCYREQILPACAAIFLHNLSEDKFANNKIDISKAPLAFLLKLTDEFQDWERPGSKAGKFSAEDYGINGGNKNLVLTIRNVRKRKIKETLESCLSIPENIVIK